MDTLDPILENAKAKRKAALAEAARWSDFIEMYSELRGGAVLSGLAAGPRTNRQLSQSTTKGSALAETELAAVEAIRQAGRPLHTRELLLALEHAGIEIGGKDPPSTLSARLSRAPMLENVRPHGWRIRPEPEVTSEPQALQQASVFDEPRKLPADGRWEVDMQTGQRSWRSSNG